MTDVNSNTCTALTILIEGKDHKKAAEAFMIQFADGGLDEEFEARLENQGYKVSDTDFNLEKNEMKIIIA